MAAPLAGEAQPNRQKKKNPRRGNRAGINAKP